ncbi:SEC-C domain-containing protein [Tenacibaculum finnmarkense genomovar finnmarkense]|uniref:SEC-C domain-containing protein n=1 Tax=Tenacibaculum finnmarkense TaxID=2781243 RepID=UPI001E48669F|nr:SEC-C domain-containing protein [Tenacibaculum finnmarkense]MCD8416388.1 SEC-C domain-containing protein [Tenacibaculum finnmarkense genomovar finnmarkense]MCG8185048.1 SEC-C domain-containing protein [Tenacibaculum finnmarkense genomovar finnmarkense]MCG8201118.1 SEC-C domain-containing protein [Tenacibaculum finnmarkense genomovar finnmarkense]MCG8209007.1 SEC-C domain-containing protein [Tenacibaculum finnmarkense genomovar finnmarkense]MCG8211678.1 SEC-C domain-containing protein [Tenac
MVIDNQINIILKKYPFLTFNSEERYFTGIIQIDEDDRYNLKIDISKYSNKFPKVFEIDERIPRKADRHINSDSSLCFTTAPNEEILTKTLVKDLESFFKLILIPYLINNSYFEINKEYKYGGYNHHPIYSIYETYVDILGINNGKQVVDVLQKIANGKKFRPNELCYCGSAKKIKKCNNHEKGYRNIKKISSDRLNSDSLKILKLRDELIKINNM